jgi:(2Fe-2S) ferredoxin
VQPYRIHIFVCLGKRCAKKGSEALLDELKELVKEGGLKEQVRVSRSGCVKSCKETDEEGEYSPIVLVYPLGVWYKNVGSADLPEILESHMEKGEPVKRLLHFINPND